MGALAIFWLVWYTTGIIAVAQTATFAALGTATLVYVFSLRNIRLSIWRHNIFSNWYLNLAIAVSFGLQLAAIYLPWLQHLLGTATLEPYMWTYIGVYVMIIVLLIELIKMFFSHNQKKNEVKK